MKDDTISRQAAIETVRKAKSIGQAHRMLVQLPSAQPDVPDTNVGDMISRQAAIEKLTSNLTYMHTFGADRSIDLIEELPSAQPGWIPWDSGKFPEESGTYTVTAYDGATKRVTYAKYQKRLKRWELTGSRAYWRVLAWMPLPEPWKGEQP